jgi:hypothetical protein
VLEALKESGKDDETLVIFFRKSVGQWNEQEILCRGRRITVIVNEMVVLDADLDKSTTAEVREKHPGLGRHRGHIGLLGHGSRVEFRNIRVKETPDTETADER